MRSALAHHNTVLRPAELLGMHTTASRRPLLLEPTCTCRLHARGSSLPPLKPTLHCPPPHPTPPHPPPQDLCDTLSAWEMEQKDAAAPEAKPAAVLLRAAVARRLRAGGSSWAASGEAPDPPCPPC